MNLMTKYKFLLIYYKCDFEEKYEDCTFDSYWIVHNISSYKDHTYGNLSGHYITYTNTSISQPLTIFLPTKLDRSIIEFNNMFITVNLFRTRWSLLDNRTYAR